MKNRLKSRRKYALLSNKQSGVVLFFTLIFISVLTLIAFALMQHILLFLKINNQFSKKQHVFYQLEAAALHLANNPVSTWQQACLIQQTDPNQIINDLHQNKGCSFNDESGAYRYLISDLGVFPCLRIFAHEHLYNSHHWLITLVDNANFLETIQLRIARSVPATLCIGIEKIIPSGLLSWRYLNL